MYYKLILFTLIFFFLFSSRVFAEDFVVTGRIVDQNNNPVPKGIVEFINNSGENIETEISAGSYSVSVPEGIYTVKAEGPEGSGIGNIEKANQAISADVNIDMTIAPVEASASIMKNDLLLPILGLIVIGFFILLVLVWLIKRR